MSAAERFCRFSDAVARAWLVDDREINTDNVRRAYIGIACAATLQKPTPDTDTAIRARAIYKALEEIPCRVCSPFLPRSPLPS